MLAAASEAVIIGFNVRPVGDARARRRPRGRRDPHLLGHLQGARRAARRDEGMLAPEEVEETVGQVEVRQTSAPRKIGTSPAPTSPSGKVARGAKVRVVRDGTVIYDTTIAALRRFNDDVREVAAGLRVRHRRSRTTRTSRKATSSRSTRRGRSSASSAVVAAIRRGPGAGRSDRMRRVDEAVREVLSDAVTQDLKDPRVGFVTVTDVKTSPDLRHARVYVSVLGDDARSARRASTACSPPTASCRRRVAGELRMKHTPQLDFVYDDTAGTAAGSSELIEDAGGRAS